MTALQSEQEQFMEMALEQARSAFLRGEIPVGVLIVRDGAMIATGHNTCEANGTPLDHAEIIAIRAACGVLGNWRLSGCTLYTTLEPCMMCLGAIMQARVDHLVYGCFDPKRPHIDFATDGAIWQFSSLNAVHTVRDSNHVLSVSGGVCAQDAQDLLRSFFRMRR